MDSIFRAYDVRGIFNKELTPEIALKLGLSFGTFIGRNKSILLSKDTRFSGEVIENAFLAGIINTGCNVLKVDTVPLPVFCFAILDKKLDYGVFISASHNPLEYNGIRFRSSDGSGFLYYDIKKIFESNEFTRVDTDELGNIFILDENLIYSDYINFLKIKIKIRKNISVLVDPGNGSAYKSIRIFNEFGCKVLGINTYPHGSFPGRGPHPSNEALKNTCKSVIQNNQDLGVAFDADSDRGIIIDNLGRIVPSEKIALILLKEYKNTNIKIIASMDCSTILEKELKNSSIEVIREKVGDVFISEAVKNQNATIGFERSGHFFIHEFHNFDDPFVMSLKLIEVLSGSNKKLSELADEIKDIPYCSSSIPCPDEYKFKVLDKLELYCRNKSYQINNLDGVRIQCDDWVVLIRASNTQPLIRIYIESPRNHLKYLWKKFELLLKKNINYFEK